MKKVLIGVLLAAFLISLATAMAASDTVDLNEAKKVAEKFTAKLSTTKEFKEWKDAKVRKIITCYDVDEGNRDRNKSRKALSPWRAYVHCQRKGKIL